MLFIHGHKIFGGPRLHLDKVQVDHRTKIALWQGTTIRIWIIWWFLQIGILKKTGG